MTVLEVLTSASQYLAERGVENPRLNAEYLLARVLSKRRLDLYLEFDHDLSETERAPLRELVRHRGMRHPLQHLLGTTEFYGREFLCDSRALIPRPETEQLIELALPCLPPAKPITLLDVGTGSGVIAVTLALELPYASVDATDLSPDALVLAARNLAKYQLTERIRLQQADLFPTSAPRYEAIFANLPYIPSQDIAALSPEVRHDPLQALDGGSDGLYLIRRLIHSATPHLQPKGWLWLEIGHNQGETVVSLLEQNSFDEIHIIKDYQNLPRFVAAKK